MFSGPCGGKDLVAVKVIGRRDVDGVDVLGIDPLLQARGCVRDPVLFRVARRAVCVRAHDGDRFNAIGAESGDHTLCGDRACADQSPTKFCHQCPRV
jgi:hypothetical protein